MCSSDLGLGGPSWCIFNRLLGGAAASGLRPHLEVPAGDLDSLCGVGGTFKREVGSRKAGKVGSRDRGGDGGIESSEKPRKEGCRAAPRASRGLGTLDLSCHHCSGGTFSCSVSSVCEVEES